MPSPQFLTSGLVPRQIAMFGVVGGPLIFASSIVVLFDLYEQDGAHFLFSIPEIVFEVSIAVYTLWKGFRPSHVFAADPRSNGASEAPAHRILVAAP
jgi:hypothetical protein